MQWFDTPMNAEDVYEPSPRDWVRDHVATIEEAGDTRATSMKGLPIVVMTMRGARSGKIRKVPVMRVEHDGRYVAVASHGGAPQNPKWYKNLVAHPDIELQDGTEVIPVRARELEGQERYEWWLRAVEAFPPYAEYQVRTQRQIPVFLLEPR